MLAKDNDCINEAIQTLYECNSDALIQEQCRARETRLFFERSDQAKIQELSKENTSLRSALTEKDAENARLRAEIALLKAQAISPK